ncbi:MAG: hypothetical protein HYX34_11030 [Actinobacteria bacterium]|nr:hypothetical protein [Actinomycetota bacterium]
MPWCDECARFYDKGTLPPDGTCPHCGAFIVRPSDEETGDAERSGTVPWHFWLVVVALAVYLGWRLIQGIAWVAAKL